jgi:zinc protease
VVAGDASLEQILPLLEKRLGDWKTPEGAPTLPAPTPVALPDAVRLYLIDQPGATQSNIYVGQLIPPTGAASTIDFDFANTVLGGVFTSRLNMNLREDKHWAYGANSRASNAVGQRPWLASAAVQTDKTAESVAERLKEITALASGSKPASDAEIAKVRAASTLRLPGGYETAAAVLNLVATNLRYGRPDDYLAQLKARSEAMTAEQVQAAAKTIAPGSLLYVVVGDLAKIEAPVRALGLGEATRLDADGKPLATPAPATE